LILEGSRRPCGYFHVRSVPDTSYNCTVEYSITPAGPPRFHLADHLHRLTIKSRKLYSLEGSNVPP